MPAKDTNTIDVYLEIGQKKTFAGAVEWPGWCRSGRDEASALQALFDYAQRYGRVLAGTSLEFRSPADVSALTVVERLPGNATTDFGAPALAPSADERPLDEAELRRSQALLRACWQALDDAVNAARDKELRKGPRGGGRELAKILDHVRGSEAGYLASIGGKLPKGQEQSAAEGIEQARQVILEGLAAAASGEVPSRGPRGGERWTPRYFVRRLAWHTLDHAWELEDRII